MNIHTPVSTDGQHISQAQISLPVVLQNPSQPHIPSKDHNNDPSLPPNSLKQKPESRQLFELTQNVRPNLPLSHH